jgi:hypothetical protein
VSLHRAAEKVARGMGQRAAERFRETGVPSPNPFAKKSAGSPAAAVLAAAWRSGNYASRRSARAGRGRGLAVAPRGRAQRDGSAP